MMQGHFLHIVLTRIDLGEEKTDAAIASRQTCQQKQHVFDEDDVRNPAPAASILFTPSFNIFFCSSLINADRSDCHGGRHLYFL